MEKEALEILTVEVKKWLRAAKDLIMMSFSETIEVSEKSARNDLVTNIDQEVQAFLIEQIKTYDPEANILAEESGENELSSLKGHVWVIDPIDGTLNFILQRDHFCIMLGYFEEGVGQVGFIYEVMTDELFWGGPALGVFTNEEPLLKCPDTALVDGLLGFNAVMYGHDRFQTRRVGDAAMGIRISGCAGIELTQVLKGELAGYVSNLYPWDYAAGKIMLETLGYQVTDLFGKPLPFRGRTPFLAAGPRAHAEILEKVSDKY